MITRRARGLALGAALGTVLGVLAGGLAPARVDASTGTDMVTVLVTMEQQADLDGVTGATRQARLRSLIETLQAAAADGQDAITTRLDTLAAQGSVSNVDPLWVVDALSVTATPSVVSALAARPDVADVVSDAIELVPATTAEPNVVTSNAPAVWDRGDTGGGVVVATLDSGADVTHPDLAASWRGGTNSWYDPYGQHPDAPVDLSGHGTATLGAIVGGDSSGSSIGVAPGTRWIAARVFDDRGASSTTAVHQAFQWLLDPDGDPTTADAPQVVNGSWSLGAGPGCDLTFQPDVQALEAAGVLPVFAAGNYGSGAGTDASPANYPESLAVGALGDADTVLASSSRGPSTCGGRTGAFPDVTAPGRDILTTDRYGLYQVASGTSIAAPQVAGVLALTLAAHPGLTPAQQRDALTSGAADIGPPGPDPDTGYGRVDALASYDLATAPDFTLTAPGHVTIPAGGAADISVTVAPTRGFTGDVALASGATGGITATTAPPVLVGGAGTATVTVTVPAETTPGDVTVTVTGTSGRLTHSAQTTVSIVPAPDFTLGTPATATVTAGSSVDVPVSVAGSGGFSADVALEPSASGGLAAVAAPGVVIGGNGSATVTVTAPGNTVPATYDVVVTGRAGGLTRTATTAVTVTAAPDFSVTAQPASVSVIAGSAAAYTVSLAPTSGSPGAATLTVTAPAGTTASVSPATLPGATGTSTVTITTTGSTAPGTYPVTIDVAADGVRHSTALSLTVLAAPPPTRLELSTFGNANPRGLTGTADDADIIAWDGATFRRVVDASAGPWSLPSGANVDGFARLDATRFYVSFAGDVRVNGLGTVQDEDVLLFDGTRWTTWFDGTARGLTSAALDLDAISVVNGTLYFSTFGSANPPGVRGDADDADVYRWDGRSFSRVWDASARGLPTAANVDGLDVTDATHFALSFSTSTVAVPRLGTVQDEDVIRYADGVWTTLFDGTAVGLTTDALDVDAFDIP